MAPAGSGSPVGYTPPQIRAAYGINQVEFGTAAGDGSGQTIAIVCAYTDPALSDSSSSNFATSDLAQFDQEFDLPDPPSFTVLNEYGTDIGGTKPIPRPGTDPSGAWEATEVLDVEWAHAIAPGASIVLVECNSDSATDLLTGATTAASLPGVSVVSVNRNSGADPALSLANQAFTTPTGHQGVTFVAPTGDSGSPGWSAAYSSNVVAVGGTTLNLNSLDLAAPYVSEQGWSGSGGGGGTSQYGIEPAFQDGVQSTGYRTIPDVAFDADPSTGVAVYDSYNNGAATPWNQAGGTSLGAACWAGLVAIANQGRIVAGGTTLDGASQTLPALYSLPAGDFHDVTSGSNGGFTAGPGYDLVTGLGTPQANVLVSDLVSYQLGSQLVVSSEPPASVSAGAPFGLTVTALDRFGDVETSFEGTVTIAIGVSPGDAPLRGTLWATATNGVVVFQGLSIDTAGTGYALLATGLGTAAATTSFINVTPGAAVQLAVTTEAPAAVAVNSSFGLAVAAEDIYGNVDTSFEGSVTVALANNPGGGALSGMTAVTASQGVAVFDDLAINVPSTDLTLQATSTGLASATTGPFTVTPSATQLVVTSQPPATVVAGADFGLTVAVDDAASDVVSSYSSPVTVALASGPAGSILSGPLTVTAASGVASFTGLSLDEAGSYTFVVSSSLLAGATTDSVTVTPGSVAQLVVTTPPPLTTTAGVPFGLAVSAEDTYGNVETSFEGNIKVALVGSTVALAGTLTATANAGVATFSGLVLDTAGSGYSLQASDGGLATTSSPMSVTPAPAARLVVTIPPPQTVTAGSGFGLTVVAEDPFGNVATTYDNVVDVALGSAPPGTALGGATAITAAAGVAGFTGLTLDTVAAGYSLMITSGSLTTSVSSLNVTPGPAAELGVTTQPPASTTAGSSFGLVVSVEDAFGNPTTNYGGNVTVALATGVPGSVLGGTTTVGTSLGVAAFSGLVLDLAGTNYTIQAAATGLTPATTNAFSVTPGAATKLAVTTPPPGSLAAGSSFGLAVSADDAFGNAATSFAGNVTIAIAAGPSGAGLSGTATVAARNGVAAFAGLSLGTPGAGYTFQVTSSGLTSTLAGPVNVTPTASQLLVRSQPPGNVVAGTTFGLTVVVADASGNLVPSYNGSVTVALASNPGGGTLSGSLTVTASGGVATFAGLSINTAGAGYTLRATSGALASALTAPINVTAGAVPHLAIFDGSGVVMTGSDFEVTVDAEDSQGMTETSFAGDVTLTLAAGPTGAILGGNRMLPASGGQVTFYGLTLNLPGSGYTILATASGFAAAATPPIVAVDPPATQLIVSAGPPASVLANQAFGLTVVAVDAAGALDSSFDGSVTVALVAKRGGGELRGTLTVTAVGGVATFSGLAIGKPQRGERLRVTASGLTPAFSSVFAVTRSSARRPAAP